MVRDNATRRGSRPAGESILFISHDAWRTGAPIVLLHFLRWLKSNTSMPFSILLREGVGELRPQFEQLAPVFAWNELPVREPEASATARAGFFSRFGGRGGRGQAPAHPTSRERFAEYLRDARVGLIYSNTITNGEVLEALAGSGCPVVTHVHELGFWIAHRMDPVNVEQNRRHTSRFIAVSQAVRDNLVNHVGIAPERVDVVHEFIQVESAPPAGSTRALRARLGIPDDAFVVGGAGTTDWRKAPDLFVQLAAAVRRRRPDETVHFVWVGGEHQGPMFEALWHDAVRADVADRLLFVGAQPHPLDYFAIFDAFAMVSREDPFPLVALEAASLGKPVITFDRSGGTREFVQSDAGIVVPYLDIDAMATAVHRLRDDPDLRLQLAACAAEKVRHSYDINVAAPRLLAVIQRFFSTAPRS